MKIRTLAAFLAVVAGTWIRLRLFWKRRRRAFRRVFLYFLWASGAALAV